MGRRKEGREGELGEEKENERGREEGRKEFPQCAQQCYTHQQRLNWMSKILNQT